MDNIDCAIVVMSCDTYSDLWKDFFELKRRNWADCPYTTYLVTNNLRCNEYGVKNILCGDEYNWTGRLTKCLNEIPEKYIILLLDDFYISDYVSTTMIENVISFIDSNNVAYYRIEATDRKFATPYKKIDYLRIITPDKRYGVSLSASIWDKNFLREVINGDDCTPWEFELKRNDNADVTKTTDKLMLIDTRDILNIINVVQRGKYLRWQVKKIREKGYIINTDERGMVSIFFEPYEYIARKIRRYEWLRKTALRIMHLLNMKTISEKYEEEAKKGIYK